MANYYSQAVAAQTLKCTKEQCDEIAKALDIEDDDVEQEYHGFSINFYGDELLLVAEESGVPEELPFEATRLLGQLIALNDLPYLEVGMAFTCDKLRPGSCGGTAIRIHRNGKVEFRVEKWEGIHGK